MPNQKSMLGIVAVLFLLLAISATIGIYYYVEYNQQVSTSASFASELNSANAKYNQTATKYNSIVGAYGNSLDSFRSLASLYNQTVQIFNSLSSNFSSLSSNYNRTLSLLVASVSVLNTSEPAYENASLSLNSLWTEYNSLEASYRNVSGKFESLFTLFQMQISSFERTNNVSLEGNLLVPVKPVSTSLLTANLVVVFGNSSYVWSNDTSIQAGWNGYLFTVIATNGEVNATWYPQYGEHLVTGIDGASQTSTQFWWFWNYNGTAWQLAQTGSDETPILNGTSVAWTLCPENSNFLPTCTPP